MGRVCSECGKSISHLGPKAVTCGTTCRSRRARRLARATAVENGHATLEAVKQLANQNIDQSLARTVEQQLVPVVREAITEDVYRAIQDLIGLTPKAVAALQQDLESDDDLVRQKATALLLKYTVGHPALTDKDTTSQGNQINVSFALPRPDDVAIDGVVIDEDKPEETQECDMCHESKPLSQFVTGSSRCWECFTAWNNTVREKFASGAPK